MELPTQFLLIPARGKIASNEADPRPVPMRLDMIGVDRKRAVIA
jgi:hypothetical protein